MCIELMMFEWVRKVLRIVSRKLMRMRMVVYVFSVLCCCCMIVECMVVIVVSYGRNEVFLIGFYV